jgi:glycosyltransferase involved in cell wall biosynthesis
MDTIFATNQDTHLAPRLSIIIATRNAAGTFEGCLHSIFAQEFTDWELLISDGASTDGTVELIRQHEAHIAWWQSENDSGIYDAWNQALTHARGEYVCFIGADDALADHRALTRLDAAIGTQQYDLVTSRGLIFWPKTGKKSTFGSAWDYQRIGRRIVVCHPGLLHRRSLFERYGMFDSRYRIGGDLDFLLRMPPDVRTLHVDTTTVIIEAAGISRKNVLARLREQREILTHCKRYGRFRAYVIWADKLWRYPIARFLHIPH